MANTQIRIAMWSGPRNISTAMMRAWGSRSDTSVIDEPFYAFYLSETHAGHPGSDEVIASGETDWRRIVTQLTGPNKARIFYQKQMTHHLLAQVDRSWLAQLTNCFLIRDPAEVIASYIRKNHDPATEDLGFTQQLEIFDCVRRQTGSIPPVVDADDVLRNPKKTLHLLCEAVGVEFDNAMLSWRAGRHDTDGIWAKYWYAEVERSTSFAPRREKKIEVPKRFSKIERRCRECYERLYEVRLR